MNNCKLYVPGSVFDFRSTHVDAVTIKARIFAPAGSSINHLVAIDSRNIGTWHGFCLLYFQSFGGISIYKRESVVQLAQINQQSFIDTIFEISITLTDFSYGSAHSLMRINGVTVSSCYINTLSNGGQDMFSFSGGSFATIGAGCDSAGNGYLLGVGVWECVYDESDYVPDFYRGLFDVSNGDKFYLTGTYAYGFQTIWDF